MSAVQKRNVTADELVAELRALAQSPVVFMLYTAYKMLEETRELLRKTYETLRQAGENTEEVERLMQEQREYEQNVISALREHADVEIVAKLLETEKEEVENERDRKTLRRA